MAKANALAVGFRSINAAAVWITWLRLTLYTPTNIKVNHTVQHLPCPDQQCLLSFCYFTTRSFVSSSSTGPNIFLRQKNLSFQAANANVWKKNLTVGNQTLKSTKTTNINLKKVVKKQRKGDRMKECYFFLLFALILALKPGTKVRIIEFDNKVL